MTIFAVLLPTDQPALVDKIKTEFASEHYEVTPHQWLISAPGTALDVVAKLGIFDPKELTRPAIGNAIVFATSSYHGRAPTPTWDWIKAKLEGVAGG